MTPQKKRRRTWFDVQPTDVITRIATFLSAREHTPSTLTFAQLAHHTNRAVAAALDFRLIIDTTTHLQAASWRLVFSDSLRHLTISAALPFNSEYLRLLQAPRLHTLSIPPHPEYLEAITASPTLRNLSVTFVENVLAAPGLPQLIKVLPTLRITNLSLLSESSYVPTLFQDLFTAFHSDPPLLHLGKSCPHVETLHIGVKLWSMRQLLPVLQRFHALRNLSLSGIINLCPYADEPLVHFLRHLDTVQLLDVGYAPTLAVQLGAPVTTLSHGTMDLSDLQALTVCHNLDVLHIDLQDGQETALRQLAKRLRSLRLRWQYRDQRGFYAPQSGVLLDIVKGSPKLTDLHLRDVHVSLTEASSIMEVIGANLKSFGFPLTCKGQTAVDTLICLATTGAKYNPELEELCPSAREELFSAHHWGWRPQIASPEDKERLMRALNNLHRHAPRLKAGVLERLGRILPFYTTELRTISSDSSFSDICLEYE